MPVKKKSMKWTAAQKKKHIGNIQSLVEKLKRENKLENFRGITPAEIEQKFKRVNSPMIVSQGWGNATPGGAVDYNITIYNPDPITVDSMLVHVWVGTGNIDPDPGSFLQNIDTRFARLTQPAPVGFSLAPGAYVSFYFQLAVSSTVEKSGYIGNSCLMQFNFFDTGTYLDRGAFVFNVT